VLCAACTTDGGSNGATTTAVGGGSATSTAAGGLMAATTDGVVKDVMASRHLRAVIVKVSKAGQNVITAAYGESLAGVPATTDMHFRNGAVAISYVSTALLRLVDQKKVSLDDRVSRWLPDLKYGDQVTLGQLAQMTAGYVDYVNVPGFAEQLYENPFRHYTPEELVAVATSQPLAYPPGTNWNYSHTDYVILGLALEKITGRPFAEFLQDTVLTPLGLTQTVDPGTPVLPAPALHAFTSERRETLGVAASTAFYEESTSWDPSWTITRGAVQTTTIADLDATAIAIGTGKLLSPESYAAMTSKALIGRTKAIDGCTTCAPMRAGYTYGLGLISTGSWLIQNPLFAGQGGAFAYLPSEQLAISVAVTFQPEAFGSSTGFLDKGNSADYLWRRIATALAPNEAPQIPPGLA
jgi:CubicO group peptidase (beta-lactamase class C family)